MNLKDCSLLIQGPPHQHSIINIDYIKDVFGEIVYSTYPMDEYIYNLANNKDLYYNTKFIVNEINHNHALPDNVALTQQNFEKHVLSTYNGLKQCTKKYVLKMRTDEYYLGLKNIDDFVDDNKVNFINVFFRHFNQFPYHPSDHMFLAEKELLLKSFALLYDACYYDFEMFMNLTCQDPNVQLFAEQAICLSILYNITRSKIPFKSTSTNIMLFNKFFHIFTAKSIGPYCICTSRINHTGKQFVTNVEHSPLRLKTDCNSIGQYK